MESNINIKISQLRKLAGLTQKQMANILGIPKQSVSKWESGTSMPDWESMVKISKLYGISLDEFTINESNTKLDSNDDMRIRFEDLIEIHSDNKRRQLLLIFSIIFLLISMIGAIVISIVNSSTISIQYMFYRYMVTGEYIYATADYFYSYIFAIFSGIVGLVLATLYFIRPMQRKKIRNNILNKIIIKIFSTFKL